MTVKPAIQISDGNLTVKDRTILTNVPENVTATSGTAGGVFLGASLDKPSSCHVSTLGTLRGVRFLSCFRFKLWWMAQKMGDRGRDIHLETQFMLLETRDDRESDSDDNVVYAVLLPLLEGPFKACLQGTTKDEVELCLESGDNEVVGSTFTHSVYVGYGSDPFAAVYEAIKAVKMHLGTFRLRDEKEVPGIVDCFGWCTWNAFYQEVSQEGVEAGLKSFEAGGVPLKFVIIDDGWQSVGVEEQLQVGDVKQLPRLTGIKENEKFRKKEDPSIGIKNIVNIAKEKHGLKYVYVWHAITGYWGGVDPTWEEYGAAVHYSKISKGVVENEPAWINDTITVRGLGLMNPKNVYKFYDELHSYLASTGIDGVKVDLQSILETLGEGFGGRVEIAKQYHHALDASVANHFSDNGYIASMSHNLESLYFSKQCGIIRVSEDFYPEDPESHTIHISSVAYNSIFLGEIMLADWDMFHSLHPAADYHASARAISGGPVYVSDAPGKHNFDLLRKLVLPDGSILRARLAGRPTKDCLFSDPARDGISLLKIWNMNKYTGVLGVYNCQGAAWNNVEKKNTFHETKSEAITGYIRGHDVHLISDLTQGSTWDGNVALYSYRSGDLIVLPYNVAISVSLKVLEYEIYTITPIKVLAPGLDFAPFGLINMFNSGGAIEGLRYDGEAVGVVSMEIKGCGRFGAYSSKRPRKCTVGSDVVEFEYDSGYGLVKLDLAEMPMGDQKVHEIMIEL